MDRTLVSQALPPWLAEANADVVVRIPKLFAAMIANYLMWYLAVFDMSHRRRPKLASPSWSIGWDNKGNVREALKALHDDFATIISEDGCTFCRAPDQPVMRAHEDMGRDTFLGVLGYTRRAVTFIPEATITNSAFLATDPDSSARYDGMPSAPC